MNKINKFLVLFLGFVVILIIGTKQFLESEYFGSIITYQMNKEIKKNGDLSVDVGSIGFSFAPIKTILKDVKLLDKKGSKLLVEKISLELSFWDFFRSDLKISRIKIDNGYIKHDLVSETNNQKMNIFKLIKEEILTSLPFELGELQATNLDVFLNNQRIEIKEMRIRPYTLSIDFEAEFKKLKYKSVAVDMFSVKGEILEEKIRVIDSRIKSNLTQIKAFGEIDVDLVHNLNFEIDYSGDITEFTRNYNIDEYINQGDCSCLINISGSTVKPLIQLRGEIENFKNSYMQADKVTLGLESTLDDLVVKKVMIEKDNGAINLKSNVFMNYKTQKISVISASIHNFHSHDLLYFLGSDFNVFSSRISGDAKFSLIGKRIYITNESEISLIDSTIGLTSRILDIKNISFEKFSFNIEDNILFNISGKVNDSPVLIVGNINGDDLDIRVNSSLFNLGDLGGEIGKIASGSGDLSAHFHGKGANVELLAKSNQMASINILGYNIIGNSTVDVVYDFNKNQIKINSVNNENNRIKASGIVDLKKETVEIELTISKLKLLTLSEYVNPVWQDIRPYLNQLDGIISGTVNLKGRFDKINILLDVASEKISLYKETLKSMNLSLNINSEMISVKRIEITREAGFFDGSLDYSFSNGLEKLNVALDGMKLNEFVFYRKLGLGYDGVLNSKISYTKKKGYDEGAGVIQLLSSSIGRKKIKPSTLTFNIANEELLAVGSLLGDRIKFESKIFVGSKNREYSTLKSSIKIEDLKLILGILSLHNVYDTDLNGEFVADLFVGLRLSNYEEFDLNISLKKFLLRKYNRYMILNLSKSNNIKIERSVIKDFDIKLEGNGGDFELIGSGDISKEFILKQKFDVDLALLSILSSKIERVGGRFYGKGEMSGNFKAVVNKHALNGENISLSLKNEAIGLSALKFKADVSSKLLTIQEIDGYLGNGKVSGKGYVQFEIPYPKVNLSLKMDDIIYPFANNSRLSFDGYFDFIGEKFPYILRGNIEINAAKIEDEFTSFMNDTTSLKSVDKYIDIRKKGLPDIIRLDIKARTVDNIIIRNRLADLLLYGDAKITGDPLNPEIKGQINVVPILSKFKFKGNEFVINDGVVFYDAKSNSNVLNLNFTSEAKINQYDIKMNIVGSEDDLKLNMESNPSLSKEDIFSLLTLGVTSDFTKNLEDKDRASLTTIGLGTLIVDQLKINEGLDSTLGLKLFVLPEVSENEDSPIKSSKNESANRGRTATKLKIRKTISKKVGLTFSKTFGNDESNKQEMNIDFDLNDKWSIQGVFEKESDNETKENEDGSVGADVKYKWSF